VLRKEIQPRLSLSEVQLPVSISTTCAPLGRKHSDPTGQSTRHLVPQLSPVGVGIEVDRVGQILAIDRVPRGFVNILRPCSRAQDDGATGVLSNHRDNLLMEWLDGP